VDSAEVIENQTIDAAPFVRLLQQVPSHSAMDFDQRYCPLVDVQDPLGVNLEYIPLS
jgi:hypothetical protein